MHERLVRPALENPAVRSDWTAFSHVVRSIPQSRCICRNVSERPGSAKVRSNHTRARVGRRYGSFHNNGGMRDYDVRCLSSAIMDFTFGVSG